MNTNLLKTWCNIDLDAIAHNYNYVKKHTDSRIICVVKANAYGHGAIPVASRLQKEGCDFFAVSSVEEAMELRNGGITTNILVLGYILPGMLKTAIENDISFAVSSTDTLNELYKTSCKKNARIHIKLDTGMNRTGFNAKQKVIDSSLSNAVELIKSTEHITLEGVFSHLAKADNDNDFSQKQYENYLFALDFIRKSGLEPEICHICNSDGTYNFDTMHLDAVRAGLHIYGICEDDKNFLPAMSFYTRVVDIHNVKPGEGISYGHTFTAQKDTKIAVIGAGYADGLLRYLSCGNGKVIINGTLCPIIARICMDMAMVDISALDNVKVGDIVTLWGEGISCAEQAVNAGTIPYELICGITPRVTRVYN